LGLLIFNNDRYEEVKQNFAGVRLEDIGNDNGILEKRVVDTSLGINLSWVEYFRLRTEFNRIRARFPVLNNDNDKATHIDNFITGKRKGCKRYRMILTGRWSRVHEDSTPQVIAAGVTLWGEGMGGMPRELVEMNYGLWTNTALDPGYREFLFKLVHGRLYLNNQVAHFGDVSPLCTFCEMVERKQLEHDGINADSPEANRRLRAVSRETVSHLFWECTHVRSIINRIINFMAGTVDRGVDKQKYFGGCEHTTIANQRVVLTMVHFLKYVIYKKKQWRVLPTIANMKYEINDILGRLSRRVKWRESIHELSTLMGGVLLG
jgi:hypothetical protein